MLQKHQRSFLTSNHLLAALSPSDFDHLWARLEFVLLPLKLVLYEPNSAIEHVHFMEAGICSMVAVADLAPSVEIGMVGREGLVGLPIALGSATAPHQAIIQIEGSGHRMSAETFSGMLEQRAPIRAQMLRYASAMMAQVAQTAACNGRHTIDSRLARWLLTVHDRVNGDEITLTQKFLGQMLGVRRAGVTTALQALEAMRTIEVGHGSLVVIDRAKLEHASCRCYAIVEGEFGRQLGRTAS